MYRCTRARVRSRKDPIYINSLNDLTKKLKYTKRDNPGARYVSCHYTTICQFVYLLFVNSAYHCKRIYINGMTKSV